MAGTKPQDIFIADRQGIAASGATLSNIGGSILFAAIVAGLVINFPWLFRIGLAVYALALGTSIFVAWPLLTLLLQLRRRQESLFAALPPDDSTDGYERTTYRRDVIALKPDLEIQIASMHPAVRTSFLLRSVWSALQRELRP